MPPNEPAPTPQNKKRGGEDAARTPPATSAPTVAAGFPDPAIMADTTRDPRDDSPNPMPRGATAKDVMAAPGLVVLHDPSSSLDDALRGRIASLDNLESEMREKLHALDVKLGLAPDDGPKPDGPGKLLGHVPVYANDSPELVVERARELRRGNIPVAAAKRFRTTARINAVMSGENPWPLSKRIKEPALPLNFEFSAEEMPLEERVAFFEAGAIEAIE